MVLAKSHILGVYMQRDDLCIFAMPLSILTGFLTKGQRFSDWRRFSYDAETGPNTTLSHDKVNLTLDRSNAIMILGMHAFTPMWKRDALFEVYIFGFGITVDRGKRVVSYRVQLAPPSHGCLDSENHGVRSMEDRIALIDAGCARTSILPWNRSCVTNSGLLVMLKEELQCYSLFQNSSQPQAEIGLERHPRDCGDYRFVTAVDPWSGKFAVLSSRQLTLYHFEPPNGVRRDVDAQ